MVSIFVSREIIIYLCESVAITKNSKMWSKNRPCDRERVKDLMGLFILQIFQEKELYATMVIIEEKH